MGCEECNPGYYLASATECAEITNCANEENIVIGTGCYECN